MMKTSTNKKAYNIWKSYENSKVHAVRDAYKTNCSDAKQFAEIAIMSEMNIKNGYGYRIISSNGFMFTCGYLYRNENNDLILVYHSKTRRDEILVDTTM